MLLRDLVLAARTLRKNLTFSLTAVVMIGFGIGAVALMFSVINPVLLRPLPYKDPDHLVVAYGDLRTRTNYGLPLSNETFVDIVNGSKDVFEDLAGLRTGRMMLAGRDGTPEQVRFGLATINLFRTLGARVVVGRDFEESDGQAQASREGEQSTLPNYVILSHEFWRRRYGMDRGILGQSLDGAPGRRDRVVGVLAPGFELLFAPADNVEPSPDIWFANRLVYDNGQRNQYTMRPIGRLRPGVTIQRAQAAVESVSEQIRRNFVTYGASNFYARLEPMHKALVMQVRPTMLALMGSVIFLLLIACANVLNLLLVRASLRAREMAVRAALGSGTWPLLRMSLAEALVLSAAGAVLGLALARMGLHWLIGMAPANLPRLDAVRIDPVVVAVTAAVALAVAVIFGVAPLWGTLRGNVIQILRGTGRTAGLSGSGTLRSAVVILEVALCFGLLIGSGLMLRSFLELQRIDPGFDARGLLTFELLGNPRDSEERRAAHARQVEERLRAMPGVQIVSAARYLPLGGAFNTIRWGTEAALADATKFQAADWQVVRPGFFETLRTPLIESRTFTDDDNHRSRNVVVVDRFLAAKAFPDGSAIGKRILIRLRTPEPEWVEVIGVVAQRVTSLADPGREQLYFTDGFLGYGQTTHWMVRTGGDPAALATAVRAEMKSLNPKLVTTEIQPMEALVRRAQVGTKFSLTLIIAFTSIAVLLVTVGLHGVLSTVVRQRTAEIGVRMALGATPGSVLYMVVGYALRLSLAGVALGTAAAVGFTRGMTGMLVGVAPTDPSTFLATAILFVAIAAASSWLPARRAAQLDPAIALREE